MKFTTLVLAIIFCAAAALAQEPSGNNGVVQPVAQQGTAYQFVVDQPAVSQGIAFQPEAYMPSVGNVPLPIIRHVDDAALNLLIEGTPVAVPTVAPVQTKLLQPGVCECRK